MEGMDTFKIVIEIPTKFKDGVLDFLANGEVKTARGLAKGILKRCELL